MVGPLKEAVITIIDNHYRIGTIVILERTVVGIAHHQRKLLRWHRFQRECYTRLEYLHVVQHIRVLIYKHRVGIVLVSTPYLTHFSRHQRYLIAEAIAHHRNIGGFREVVGALRIVPAV